MNRYRATVSYDGGPFHGFAENPDVETVMTNCDNH